MSDIPLEDETRSVEEIIAAAGNVINSCSPQFTAEEVLAVAASRDAVMRALEDAPHADGCNTTWRGLEVEGTCNCWKSKL
jgi:hypothetical protein